MLLLLLLEFRLFFAFREDLHTLIHMYVYRKHSPNGLNTQKHQRTRIYSYNITCYACHNIACELAECAYDDHITLIALVWCYIRVDRAHTVYYIYSGFICNLQHV